MVKRHGETNAIFSIYVWRGMVMMVMYLASITDGTQLKCFVKIQRDLCWTLCWTDYSLPLQKNVF